jgi:hypothetical protein
MTTIPGPALDSLPAIVFQFSSHRLELANRALPLFPGLTPAKLSKILRGEWQKLVPEEFHPVVRKLGGLLKSEGYTTVEFPAYWMRNTVWLRIFAAAVSPEKGPTKIIGLAQDVTSQRHLCADSETAAEPLLEEDGDPWKRIRHDISSSLTSILMNCELLLDSSGDSGSRERINSILSEALRIDQFLQQYHG